MQVPAGRVAQRELIHVGDGMACLIESASNSLVGTVSHAAVQKVLADSFPARVSFDVRRLGTYVIRKTDLKAVEANLVEVRPPSRQMAHKLISINARYAHLSSAH
jgi:hypothetical protein